MLDAFYQRNSHSGVGFVAKVIPVLLKEYPGETYMTVESLNA